MPKKNKGGPGRKPLKKVKILSPEYIRRYVQMLEYQTKIYPFLPAFRDLMKLWGLRSPGAVHYTLQRLMEHGMVMKEPDSDRPRYYAQ